MDTKITPAAFKACWRLVGDGKRGRGMGKRERGKGKGERKRGKAASGDTHYFFNTRVEEREKGKRVKSVYSAASDA